jgi:hypothetical protein
MSLITFIVDDTISINAETEKKRDNCYQNRNLGGSIWFHMLVVSRDKNLRCILE